MSLTPIALQMLQNGVTIQEMVAQVIVVGVMVKTILTNRTENVKVENAVLKIITKKENQQGWEYTSARLLTRIKFNFTFGSVNVRAKLPLGTGIWPAIWMLGANIDAVGWLACGEIDIMKHWSYNPTFISSDIYPPSCSGSGANTKVGETTITDYATQFHVYSLEWTETELKFLIDNVVKYSYKSAVKNRAVHETLYSNHSF